MPKKKIPVPSDFSKPAAGFRATPSASPTPKKQRFDKRTVKPKPVPKKDTEAVTDATHPMFKGKIKTIKKSAIKSDHKDAELMPLNKFIAHSGICSRRDAVELIKKGKVKVNSLVETEPGRKVSSTDYVMYENNRLFLQTKLVYYLLNKPKDYITTTDDPEGRRTVMDLMRSAPEQRIFPVGRLDRNTTGLLLLTNDGNLTQKLSHPKNQIKKIYQVTLDKALTKKDFEKIIQGITLEDGPVPVDELAYIDAQDKKLIGIEIHIGRNRIVRRLFEHLGYEVKALDRVLYAGLTKKNLPRGTWRELSEKEILFLKHF